MSDNLNDEQINDLTNFQGVVNALIEDVTYPGSLYPCDCDKIIEDTEQHLKEMKCIRNSIILHGNES